MGINLGRLDSLPFLVSSSSSSNNINGYPSRRGRTS